MCFSSVLGSKNNVYLAGLQRDELSTSPMPQPAAYFPLQQNDQPKLQTGTLKSK